MVGCLNHTTLVRKVTILLHCVKRLLACAIQMFLTRPFAPPLKRVPLMPTPITVCEIYRILRIIYLRNSYSENFWTYIFFAIFERSDYIINIKYCFTFSGKLCYYVFKNLYCIDFTNCDFKSLYASMIIGPRSSL